MNMELREYAVKKLRESDNNRFLSNFLMAAVLADQADFEIIEPALVKLEQKYPLKPQSINEKNPG